MDKDDKVKASALNCLQQYKDELKSDKCKAQIHRMAMRASRDIRFDEVLASSCTEDRNKYCQDIQPGSARVIRCLQVRQGRRPAGLPQLRTRHPCPARLPAAAPGAGCRLAAALPSAQRPPARPQDHRNSLQQKCAAAMFDHEVRMAEDIDFKYPMKRSCAWEISSFCKNIPHGHARVIRCLEQQLEHAGGWLPPGRGASVGLPAWRARPRLRCSDEEAGPVPSWPGRTGVQRLPLMSPVGWGCCSRAAAASPPTHATHPTHATTLASAPRADMSKECKDEVVRDMNRMGQDFRLNFRLNKACESDISKLCNGLCNAANGSPCGGIVLQCLQVRSHTRTHAAAPAHQRAAAGAVPCCACRRGSAGCRWGPQQP
jgi:hypothetical protein